MLTAPEYPNLPLPSLDIYGKVHGTSITAPETGTQRQQTIPEELIEQANALMDRAQSVLDLAHGKLAPITLDGYSFSDATASTPSPERAYPPLFDALRTNLRITSERLERIAEAIRRVEL